MDEQTKKAFDIAVEFHKQLIALATGIIAITITFAKELFADNNYLGIIRFAWFVYLISIIMGIWGLMSLAGTLGKSTSPAAAVQPSLYGSNVKIPAIVHLGFFLLATFLVVLFGMLMNVKPSTQVVQPPSSVTLKVEPLKVEPLKTDTMKVESLKTETMKVEPLKTETMKVEPLKSETLKVEPLRIESKNAELRKSDQK